MARTVPVERLTPRGVAAFTAIVALMAIFFDAAIGHGLTWENDPYWTYWVTKTFLIATVFGLGTAWFGIGEGRGAVITAVHTLVLTVYYWTLAPIGLPSSPEWLDLEHTWVTGVPIHFGLIYLGYLTALWLWRRRARVPTPGGQDSAGLGLSALVVGVVVVVAAGGIASVALGEFPGVTWFLTRILITVPFLLGWWVLAGRDTTSAVSGALVLGLIWATYGHFLGPSGLPDTPLRLFSDVTPPAGVRWLDYRELWLISLPIYMVVAAVVLLIDAAVVGRREGLGPRVAAAGLVAGILATTGLTVDPEDRGQSFEITASGPVRLEVGPFYSDRFVTGTGEVEIAARDMGGRVTPLPPHDEVSLEASVSAAGKTYQLTATRPMVGDPLGRFTTWWGVGVEVEHHGETGIATTSIPEIESDAAGFALGDVSVDGQIVATGVPVHFMTADQGGLPDGATFELDVGDPDLGAIAGLPGGHLRALWDTYNGGPADTLETGRYIGGVVVLLAFVLGAGYLARRELRVAAG